MKQFDLSMHNSNVVTLERDRAAISLFKTSKPWWVMLLYKSTSLHLIHRTLMHDDCYIWPLKPTLMFKANMCPNQRDRTQERSWGADCCAKSKTVVGNGLIVADCRFRNGDIVFIIICLFRSCWQLWTVCQKPAM